MKNNINELIRLDTTEEKISELQNISMEITKLKSKETKDPKKHNRLSRDCVTTKGVTVHDMGKNTRRKRKRERYRRNI